MEKTLIDLVKASDDDNDKLLHYFSKMSLPGPIHIRLRRMFNFFNQYRIQSDDFVTYILQNKENQIEALASLLFREGFVDQNREVIGYATDLRVSPTRQAVLHWSQNFFSVLEEEKIKRNCKYIFSVVPHSQRQAYNAFIRPHNLRRGLPRYHLFRRFNLVTLHGLWPFHDLPLSGIKIRTATQNDFTPLAHYILSKIKNRALRYYDSPEGFRINIERWRDLQIEKFLIAFDRYNNIIGCTAPWSSERVQRVTPLMYDDKAKNFQDILRVLSWFRIAHPIAKLDHEFEFRHLTHLYADNPDIFYSLLYNAFRQSGKNEFLTYVHFTGELLTLPPRSFIAAEIPYGLYCILSATDPIPDFLKPRSLQTPPIFESAFI